MEREYRVSSTVKQGSGKMHESHVMTLLPGVLPHLFHWLGTVLSFSSCKARANKPQHFVGPLSHANGVKAALVTETAVIPKLNTFTEKRTLCTYYTFLISQILYKYNTAMWGCKHHHANMLTCWHRSFPPLGERGFQAQGMMLYFFNTILSSDFTKPYLNWKGTQRSTYSHQWPRDPFNSVKPIQIQTQRPLEMYHSKFQTTNKCFTII